MILLVAAVSVQAVPHGGGVSVNSRSDDGHGNYGFKYDIVDQHGAKNGRHEEGDAYGNKRGFYHITDVDGRSRRVDYVADQHGFRAVVQTNEPGTATSEPADAIVKSDQDVIVHDAPQKVFVHDAPQKVFVHDAPKKLYVHDAPKKLYVASPPPRVVVAPPPSEPIHTVYTSDLLPQPQLVRLAVPVRRARPAALPYSHSTRLFPITTRTRIVPASPNVVGPYVSHNSRIVGAAPYVSHHSRILSTAPDVVGPYVSHHSRIVPASSVEFPPLSYGTRFDAAPRIDNDVSFVSYSIVPRSHHSYLPVGSHLK